MAVQLAKGTRDHLPAQMNHRLAVLDTVRDVFTRYGFEPLETPAFERIETLLGKYGDEGEKLVFKILKRGEAGKTGATDLALRYDLTVPLARVIAMNQDLRLPFKRWQMQPVWRADRPQRGRFREFYQCDVDIVGSPSPSAEAECIAVVCESLSRLGFSDFTLRMNDRRILAAIAQAVDATKPEAGLLIAIDKLDKIGQDGVTSALRDRGYSQESITLLWTLLAPQASNEATLEHLERELGSSVSDAIATLRTVLQRAADLDVDLAHVKIDATLARGLDYYTGPVFETTIHEAQIGSVSGGGRYDGLIGMFSGREIPAVGVSLGIERIIAVLEELGKTPASTTRTDVLVTVFDEAHRAVSARTATALRKAGIATELYLSEDKLKKQFKYANARRFPWVIVIGPSEAENGLVQLKNFATGEQHQVTTEAAISQILT